MDRLCGEYVFEMTEVLSAGMLARLSLYASGGRGAAGRGTQQEVGGKVDMNAWWTRNGDSGALEVASPMLMPALKAAWLCRISLSPALHPDLFALVWSSVAAKADLYLYESVVLGETFTRMGVSQLAQDVAQLETAFCAEFGQV